MKLEVSLEESAYISDLSMENIHGMFLNLFSGETAALLHRSRGFKPFCLWAPDLIYKKEELKNFTLIVSILNDNIFPELIKRIASSREVYIGKNRAKIAPLSKNFIDIIVDYRSLSSSEIEDRKRFTFEFKTPTTFKKGKVDYPLPEPKLVFKSLIKKWNYFSAQRIDIDLKEAIEGKLTISFLDIKTIRFKLGRGMLANGFVGTVSYIGNRLSWEETRWLNILSTFSEICGIGRKCTMGMGLTEYIAQE